MNTQQYDPETQRALRLFVLLTRCYDSVGEHAARDIARHKLSGSEFGALEMLYHRGPTPLGEIAERLLLTTGSITYVIDQLEKDGLVERLPCPTDRRVHHAALTAAGRELIERIFPEHAAVIRKAVAGLSAEEQELAAELLKRLGLTAKVALDTP